MSRLGGEAAEIRRQRWTVVWAPVFATIAFATVAMAEPRSGSTSQELTTVSEVRALTPDQSRAAIPVRLKGVVTVLSGWKNSFFFQDATAGISVNRLNDSPPLQPGLEVELLGVTSPGMFAPVVLEQSATIVGPGKIPEARLFDAAGLAGGKQDSQWLAIRGVVRSAAVRPAWGRQVLFLEVDIGAGDLVTVRVHDFPSEGWRRLSGAIVTVRGVCGTVFNDKRQFVGLRIFAANLDDVKVEEPAPANPFDIPLQTLDNLFRFHGTDDSKNAIGAIERVKVRGVVTYSESGQSFYMQDGSQGLLVETSKAASVAPGSQLEVVGYPAAGRYSPKLEDAESRVIGPPRPVAPLPLSASAIIVNNDGFLSAPYDSSLIELHARLLEQVMGSSQDLLLMQDDGTVFTARLVARDKTPLFAPGSLLRLTGVCSAIPDQTHEARSFELLLRSPGDIVLLQPGPWWTRAHAAWVTAILMFMLLITWVWIAVVRRRRAIEMAFRREAQERDSLLASIVESSDDAILAKRLDGTILTWNRGAERVFGYTAAEIVGRPIAQLIPEEAREEEEYIAGKLKQGRTVEHFETVRLHKNGHKIAVSLTISPIHDADGKVVGASKVARDISARQQAETALRLSQQRYGQVLQGLSVGVWDWNLMTGEFYWSPLFKQIVGVTGESSVPHPRELASRLHPEDSERTLAMLQAHLDRKGTYDVEYRLRCESGSYIWVHATGQASWGEDGTPLRMIGSLDDISVRKRAEARLCAVVDHAVDGLITIDERGNVESYNPACERIFGYRSHEVVGRNIKILMPEPYHGEHDGYLSHYAATGEARIIGTAGREVSGRRKDGSVFPMDLSVSAFELEDGRHFSGIVRDISARKLAERKVQQQQEELENFARVLVHDLRSPVATMLAAAGRLGPALQKGNPDEAVKYAGRVLQAAGRMSQLITTLHQYTMADAKVAFDIVDMNRAVADTRDNLAQLLQESGALVTSDSLPMVFGNAPQLTQLLQNLIGNGIKYCEKPVPCIRISSFRSDDGAWVISVEDNGIGIPEGHYQMVFEPFMRMNGADKCEGTGLGLTTCKKIVERHGGRIWCGSKEAQGTTFFFTLPDQQGAQGLVTGEFRRQELIACAVIDSR
jgi:PAS domain S-box-containing protein